VLASPAQVSLFQEIDSDVAQMPICGRTPNMTFPNGAKNVKEHAVEIRQDLTDSGEWVVIIPPMTAKI
jgi:hypothetical protein